MAIDEFAAAGRPPGYTLELLPVDDDPESLRFREDVPADLRDLASFAGGFHVGYDEVTWEGGGEQAMPGAIDNPWAVYDNGQGDAESIDVTPEGEWGKAIYFICHDPPHLVLMAPDLATWLKDFLDRHLALTPLAQLAAQAPDDEQLADEYLDAFEDGRRDRRGVDRALGPAGRIVTDDPVLLSFCSTLSPSSVVLDFRDARPGDYADLDPFGRVSNFARAGSLALFAVLPDPVPPFSLS